MSEGMNQVTLFGNIGADPELRDAGGTKVLQLRVATSDRYKNKDGAWMDRTEWHHVSIFGKRAEALAGILRKGQKILVTGSNRTTSYEKDGVKRFSTKVVADNVMFGDTPNKGAAASKASDSDDDMPDFS